MMSVLTITTDNKKALEVIKVVATALGADIINSDFSTNANNDFYFLKGLKIKKATRTRSLKLTAGSLKGINIDTAKLREEAWSRNK